MMGAAVGHWVDRILCQCPDRPDPQNVRNSELHTVQAYPEWECGRCGRLWLAKFDIEKRDWVWLVVRGPMPAPDAGPPATDEELVLAVYRLVAAKSYREAHERLGDLPARRLYGLKARFDWIQRLTNDVLTNGVYRVAALYPALGMTDDEDENAK